MDKQAIIKAYTKAYQSKELALKQYGQGLTTWEEYMQEQYYAMGFKACMRKVEGITFDDVAACENFTVTLEKN